MCAGFLDATQITPNGCKRGTRENKSSHSSGVSSFVGAVGPTVTPSACRSFAPSFYLAILCDFPQRPTLSILHLMDGLPDSLPRIQQSSAILIGWDCARNNLEDRELRLLPKFSSPLFYTPLRLGHTDFYVDSNDTRIYKKDQYNFMH